MDACISTATLALAPFLVKDLISLVIDYFGDYKTGDIIYVKKGLFRKFGISYKNYPLFFWVADYFPQEEMLRVVSLFTENNADWRVKSSDPLLPSGRLMPKFRFGCLALHDLFFDVYVCPKKLKSGDHIEVL